MEEFKIFVKLSLLWVSGPFHVFWITVGCWSVGYSVKDFNDLKCSFALPPGSRSMQLPNFVTEKDTERNLIFGLQHWCHSRREFRCPLQHVKKRSSTLLGFVCTCSLHLPSHSLLGCHPLSGITGILGGRGHSLHCKESWEIFVCLLFKLLWTQLLKVLIIAEY